MTGASDTIGAAGVPAVGFGLSLTLRRPIPGAKVLPQFRTQSKSRERAGEPLRPLCSHGEITLLASDSNAGLGPFYEILFAFESIRPCDARSPKSIRQAAGGTGQNPRGRRMRKSSYKSYDTMLELWTVLRAYRCRQLTPCLLRFNPSCNAVSWRKGQPTPSSFHLLQSLVNFNQTDAGWLCRQRLYHPIFDPDALTESHNDTSDHIRECIACMRD